MKDFKHKKIVLPDGEEIDIEHRDQTERGAARAKEEKEYIPVILKRNDEISKHPDDVLESAIEEGEHHINSSNLSLFLSALSGGLIIGFAAMAVAFASVCTQGLENDFLQRLSVALVYPFGFIIVIMGATQLFTEHTALAVYPFLDRRCSFWQLHKVWGLVLIGNLSGTLCSSVLLYYAEPVIGIREGYISMAHHLIDFDWFQIALSGVLAGWLMSLGGWLVLSTSHSSSQIICIYIVTFLIGIGGLHHSIAGSAEVFTAYFLDPHLEIGQVFHFMSSAIVGNIVGGSFFVAILNYAYIRQTAK